MQRICFQCQENPVYAYLATLLLNKAGGNDFRGYCHDITLDTEVSGAIAYSKLIPHQTTPMSLTEQYDFSIYLCDKQSDGCPQNDDSSKQLCWHLNIVSLPQNMVFWLSVIRELNNRIHLFTLVKSKPGIE
ncbi:hypothetical protein GCM10007891_15420 [Methylophaga thalassica]|uniref:Protein-tyrosine-phosphatase n=1 Tax=Methylophaga thalassica TaxID=40223 RepID=A0ABQ5TUM2_9GAMM|nr:hypothetical protein [Methylophaga thalassica]GLP99688.1 hypothetical protein GCM10007891_15420 [Methylophaga thalassica]